LRLFDVADGRKGFVEGCWRRRRKRRTQKEAGNKRDEYSGKGHDPARFSDIQKQSVLLVKGEKGIRRRGTGGKRGRDENMRRGRKTVQKKNMSPQKDNLLNFKAVIGHWGDGDIWRIRGKEKDGGRRRLWQKKGQGSGGKKGDSRLLSFILISSGGALHWQGEIKISKRRK